MPSKEDLFSSLMMFCECLVVLVFLFDAYCSTVTGRTVEVNGKATRYYPGNAQMKTKQVRIIRARGFSHARVQRFYSYS